ncbi:MAG: hypothetical protein ACOYNL_07530 [Rickettsiales bacterium]
MQPTTDAQNPHPSPALQAEEVAWQMHEEIRQLARKHIHAKEATSHVAGMTDMLKRFIEQVSGGPVPSHTYQQVKAHILNGKQ